MSIIKKEINSLKNDSILNILNEQLYPKAFYRKKFFKKEDIIFDESYHTAKRVIQLDSGTFNLPYLPAKKNQTLKKLRGKSLNYSRLTFIRSKKLIKARGFDLSNNFSYSCNQILGILSSVLTAIVNLSDINKGILKKGRERVISLKKHHLSRKNILKSRLEQKSKPVIFKKKFFEILILNPKKGGFDALYSGLLGFLPKSEYKCLNDPIKKKLSIVFKDLFSLYAYIKSKSLFLIRISVERIKLKVRQSSANRKVARKILRKRIYKPRKREKLLRLFRPIFLVSPEIALIRKNLKTKKELKTKKNLKIKKIWRRAPKHFEAPIVKKSLKVLKVLKVKKRKIYVNVKFTSTKVWNREKSFHYYLQKTWIKPSNRKAENCYSKSKKKVKYTLQKFIPRKRPKKSNSRIFEPKKNDSASSSKKNLSSRILVKKWSKKEN